MHKTFSIVHAETQLGWMQFNHSERKEIYIPYEGSFQQLKYLGGGGRNAGEVQPIYEIMDPQLPNDILIKCQLNSHSFCSSLKGVPGAKYTQTIHIHTWLYH